MAVQAQYPSSILFLSSSRAGEPEMKAGDYTQASPNVAAGYLDHPTTGFFSSGGSGSSRKRGRETASSVPVPQSHQQQQQQQGIGVFSLQAPAMMTPPLVSTGLRLAFEDQSQSQSQSQSPSNPYPSSSSSSLISSLLADDLTALINQQGDEIDRLIRAQADQLRRALVDRRHRHYRSLLGAAEESASRCLREKEAELDRAARRAAELEDRVTRLRAESMAWQAKALADQATAANLHSQLHQAATAAAAAADANELPVDDAESAHIDPRRVEPSKACRSCWSRPISVVVMPCRHLSLCADCDAGALPCPLCGSARSGSVHVLLS